MAFMALVEFFKRDSGQKNIKKVYFLERTKLFKEEKKIKIYYRYRYDCKTLNVNLAKFLPV